MRTPNNESVSDTSQAGDPHPSAASPLLPSPDGGRKGPARAAGGKGEFSDDPVRSCILTRKRDSRGGLVRLALGPDGRVLPDVRAKAPGRGAWIGVTRAELETAHTKGRLRGALARAFKSNDVTVPADLPALVAAALERNALNRLGLEARAGTLLTGSERIETAARSGQLHALYHAADAGEDGVRRLAQAWRVGTNREGSELKGLVLPLGRPTLSLALGRENVVHVGLTDRLAANRVSDALDRWLHYIGPDHLSAPCGTAPQGASAPGLNPASPAVVTHEEFE